MQQNALEQQLGAPQPHELEYLENISQHLNEEFLHLKTLQIPQLGGNSGTPFHVLWRPVNEEEMEAAMSAAGDTSGTTSGLGNAEGGGGQSKRHRHSCLFVAVELCQALFPRMSPKQFKTMFNLEERKGVMKHKLLACKKANPDIMDMIMEINMPCPGGSSTSRREGVHDSGPNSHGTKPLFGNKTSKVVLVGLPGVLKVIEHHGGNGHTDLFLQGLNNAVSEWKHLHQQQQSAIGTNGADGPADGPSNITEGGVGSTAAGNHKNNSPFYLRLCDRPPALVQQLEDCKVFWTADSDVRRKNDEAVKETSYLNSKEGAFLRFLGYCKYIHQPPRAPDLKLYLDYGLFEAYINFIDGRAKQQGKQCALPTSKFNIACAATTAVKYLMWDQSHEDKYKDLAIVRAYRKFEKDMKAIERKQYPKMEKDQIATWLELSELKTAWRKFEQEVRDSKPKKGATNRELYLYARRYQEYLIMSLWLGMPPVRSHILRTLLVAEGPPKDARHPNCIYWCPKKETYCLWTPQTKTSSNTIRHAVTIALPEIVFVPIVSEFLDKWWPVLKEVGPLGQHGSESAMREQPCPLLLNTKGEQYSQPNFSLFVQDMWRRRTVNEKHPEGVKMPAKLIRDIVVTDLGERGVTEEVWESYGFMMAHTRQTQQAVYDKRNATHRSNMALKDIADQNKLTNGLVQEVDLSTPTLSSITAIAANRKRPRQTTLEEAPQWQVKTVLQRRPSKRVEEDYDVLVEWKNTWEPMSHLTPASQNDALKLPLPEPKHKGGKRAKQ